MCEISIIIVNWNGAHHLLGCLTSLIEQTFRDFEIIIVDNGSSDNSVSYIRDNFPQVRLVCLDHNRGFTGGNLAGYEVAQGRFIALLNNDTRVEQSWLEKMLEAMQSDRGVGICASRIVIDGTDLIDSIGDLFTTAFSGTKVGHLKPKKQYDRPHHVHGGCAAAILYRRSMLDEIGFLDDDFFFNHEDTDLNLRAWLCGWKCMYVPEAIVYHKVSATVGELSDMAVYHFSRNTVWVWLKNVPLSLMIRFLPHRLAYELSSAVYFCGNGKWRAYLCGKWDAIRSFRHMWRKRASIQRLIKLQHDHICRGLVPIWSYLLSRLQK